MVTLSSPSDSGEQLLSIPRAAQQLDISVRGLYRLMANGHLPYPVKVGRSSKLCQSDLDRYIEDLKSSRPMN